MVDQEVPSKTDLGFHRAAGIAAIVSAPLGVGCLVAGLAAVHFDFAATSDPMSFLHAGGDGAVWFRASVLLDLFSYYLPIVPLILTLHTAFRQRAGLWSDLFAVCLLAYCLVGAIGSAMLEMAVPPLMDAYGIANQAARQVLEAVYSAQMNDVYRGLEDLLELFLAGVGWIGFGWLLWAKARRTAALTVALGLASLAACAGIVANQDALFVVAVNTYFVLALAWAFVMGVRLLRNRGRQGEGAVA